MREIALASGITERAAISVLHDLRGAGIVLTERNGRQNVNQLDLEALAKHPGWGGASMQIPQALIDATLAALTRLAAPGALRDGPHSKSA